MDAAPRRSPRSRGPSDRRGRPSSATSSPAGSRRLALDPHVQTSEVVSAREPRVAGVVHNVSAACRAAIRRAPCCWWRTTTRCPPPPARPTTASGVAALLETARALRSGPPPRNDVIFLFTDGEERGLLGAQAFLRDDPWAYAAGVVLNFDSPGSSSPALMYETSPGNGLLVSHYLAAGHAYGSSLMYEVSRRQPVVSDFRPFVARGIPGMTFGMLDGPAYDHTAYDSIGSFSEAGLQHEGDTALALARRFGDARSLAASLAGRDLLRPDRQPRRVVPAVVRHAVSGARRGALRRGGRAGGAPSPAHARAGSRGRSSGPARPLPRRSSSSRSCGRCTAPPTRSVSGRAPAS